MHDVPLPAFLQNRLLTCHKNPYLMAKLQFVSISEWIIQKNKTGEFSMAYWLSSAAAFQSRFIAFSEGSDKNGITLTRYSTLLLHSCENAH